VRVADDGAADRVEAVQPAREGPDPAVPVGVLMERGDVAARERRGIEGVVAENDELVTVVAVEPVLRPDPHEPLPVLEEGVDGVLREPVLDGEVAKADLRSNWPEAARTLRRRRRTQRRRQARTEPE